MQLDDIRKRMEIRKYAKTLNTNIMDGIDIKGMFDKVDDEVEFLLSLIDKYKEENKELWKLRLDNQSLNEQIWVAVERRSEYRKALETVLENIAHGEDSFDLVTEVLGKE